MEIELKNITVQELVKGYQDSQEDGVVGFDGTLNIRPPYQREFVYKDAQREAVIDTLITAKITISLECCHTDVVRCRKTVWCTTTVFYLDGLLSIILTEQVNSLASIACSD